MRVNQTKCHRTVAFVFVSLMLKSNIRFAMLVRVRRNKKRMSYVYTCIELWFVIPEIPGF